MGWIESTRGWITYRLPYMMVDVFRYIMTYIRDWSTERLTSINRRFKDRMKRLKYLPTLIIKIDTKINLNGNAQ